MGELKDQPIILDRKRSPNANSLHPHGHALEELAGDEYFMTDPKKSNVETTLSSWDLKKGESYKDEYYMMAKQLFMNEYSQLLTDCISTEEEIAEAMHYDKSAGYPANSYGIHTKEQLLQDPRYVEWFKNFNPHDDEYRPIWMVTPKKEFKEREDILKRKIRLFQIPPHHLLHYQLKYGRKISERLKMFKWSAYGFNPFEGGFDWLARRLLSKRWRFSYDVSGWDKFLPIMEDLYSLLGLKCDDEWTTEEKAEFLWVHINTCCPELRFPSGDVFRKPYGNPSGSGTTTRDNILCHVIIMAHALIKACVEKTGKRPTLASVADSVCLLFGDDNIGAVDDDFSLMCDFGFLSRHFESYGMSLKFLQGGRDAPLSSLSFLGASFIEIDGVYYPQFNTVRLATAMIYDDGNLTPGMYLSKVRTLTTMAFPTKEWPLFNKAYNVCLKNMAASSDPEVRNFVNLGPLKVEDLRCFYTGQEATSTILEAYFFSSRVCALTPTLGGRKGQKCKMAQVSRGERLLNKWANDPKIGLTAEGKDWLVAVLDPFHDTELKRLGGWPDVEATSSVVRCVSQALDVSKPAGVSAVGANWDCHIALFPWLYPVNVNSTSARVNNNGTFNSTVVYGPLGGLTICPTAPNAGANWFQTVGASFLQTCPLPSVYEQGVGRLIGIGYEVTDTTASNFKQGNITVYRQSEGAKDPSFFSFVDSSAAANHYATYDMTGQPFRMPPTTVAQAMLFPGTKKWDAAKGLYQVATFHSNENPPCAANYTVPILYNCGDDDDIGGDVNTQLRFPVFQTFSSTVVSTITFDRANVRPMHMHPIHQSGCILTGLAEASTFTIVVKFYYESFPSIEEQQILVMATPSCEYDPTALELYSHAISCMPVGVPVSENGTGDWFFDVVSKIGQYAAPILGAVSTVFPAAAPFAAAAGAVGGMSNKSKTKMNKQGVVVKRKKTQKKNAALANGSRGKKGKIQGPMRAPIK